MSDYPSQSPWGPHGPQVNVPSVTPNPTAPDPPPSFQPWDPGPTPQASYTGAVGPASSGTSSGPAVLAGRPFGAWVRNLAIAGGVLGCLTGAARGFALHQSTGIVGILVMRLGIAGAAFGAGVPPAFRAAGSMLRAALWIVLAAFLWLIAMAAAGQLGWLTRLR
jgi:hypothetical protein